MLQHLNVLNAGANPAADGAAVGIVASLQTLPAPDAVAAVVERAESGCV